MHVAGLITHRQRPGTAQGVTFLNLEDETGMLNVVCSIGVMRAHRHAARNSIAVVVRGILEREEGATNLLADRIERHRRRRPRCGRGPAGPGHLAGLPVTPGCGRTAVHP